MADETPVEVLPKTTDPTKITLAYILGDNSIVSAEDLARHSKVFALRKSDVSDSIAPDQVEEPASTQFVSPTTALSNRIPAVVEPPFSAELLSKFLEIDEVHFSCARTKITDAIGRQFSLGVKDIYEKIPDNVIREEITLLKDYMANCNRYDKFIGSFMQVGLDFESVGWGTLEVVRSIDKKIRRQNHVQAWRFKVLEDWQGFVETRNDGSKVYYQNFGDKVVSKTRKTIYGDPEPFDITKDKSWSNAVWNLRDYETFLPTTDLNRAASEILYIPKYHPRSTYYGVPDYLPAVGNILGNINIRDYMLQFFEHNAVPQYAVVIKGADLSEEVKNLIMGYFSRDIKGSAHKTLVIPIPAVGEIDVHFEKLEASMQSTQYTDIRKQNQVSIMVAHGVSPAIIGIVDSANLGSGKGTAQIENYRERIVVPYQRRWSQEMNDLFQKGLGIVYTGIHFDPLSTEERSVLLKDDMAALEKGLLTINQVRERNNLGPAVDGGERLFILTTSGPLFVDEFDKPESTSIETKEVEDDSDSSEMGEPE